MKKNWNTHKTARLVCLLICIVGIGLLCLFFIRYYEEINNKPANVKVKSIDGAIEITWDIPEIWMCKNINIYIFDNQKEVYTISKKAIQNQEVYKKGVHGQAYDIYVKINYKNNKETETFINRAMFLEYDKLPKVPILNINTTTGEEPTFEEAIKPDENLWGATETNNNYVNGSISISKNNEIKYETKIKIKTRGNTTAITATELYGKKKPPYKIVLNDAYDLINYKNGGALKNKEWILLNNGNNLNTWIGNQIAKCVDVEWKNGTQFVNVIINGDWKGCYYLVPAINFESSKGLVGENGYIFENTAYWWKEDTTHFKLENQEYQMGFVINYPQGTMNDDKFLKLYDYMLQFEQSLLEGENYLNYINAESVAKWLLVRDIIGNTDGAGSNEYFYIKDLSSQGTEKSKICMGPLWDFDGAFNLIEGWTTCRERYPLNVLSEKESFNNVYRNEWNYIGKRVLSFLESELDSLEKTIGKEITESLKLEGTRWKIKTVMFEEKKDEILEFFTQRINWINNELSNK